AKSTTSAPGLALAAAIAARSEPRPLSARLTTVKVLGTGRASSCSTLSRGGTARLLGRVGRCPFPAPGGATREGADRSQDDRRMAKTPREHWSAVQWWDI